MPRQEVAFHCGICSGGGAEEPRASVSGCVLRGIGCAPFVSTREPRWEEHTSLRDRKQFDDALVGELLALYRYARRIAGADRAEDLVQDTYVRAARAWREWSGSVPAEFRAWLFRIDRNQHIDETRRDGRRPPAHESAEDVPAPEPPADDCGEALRMALESLTVADVQATLERLPADAREIIELRDMQGMSYGAIATILQVPIGTVMSRLHRARRKLRDALLEPMMERRSRRIAGGRDA